MSENFKKIAVDDQERILQAALQEFAQNGYRRASTNAIVKAAGIPKGTLFYFFDSKKKLFFYLLDDAIRKYVAFVDSIKEKPPRELFERLLAQGQGKLRFAAENPLIYRFFTKIFLDIPEELRDEMEVRMKTYGQASAANLTDNLDTSRFRDGVDVQQAVNMVVVLLEGVYARYTPLMRETKPEDLDKLIDKIGQECQHYFKLIQNGIYK